jgi:alcohol dehydrogenase class IV
VSYDRSVSADPHELAAESVWHIDFPEVRFGSHAVDELAFQLRDLGVDEGARGLVVTDDGLVAAGHADRVGSHLADAGFAVDVYDDSEREPSVEAIEACVAFVRDETDDGYDFYVGLGGGSSMDTAKTTRAVVANGGSPLDYVAEPTGSGESLTESGPPLVLVPTTAGTGSEISPVAILSVPA